LGCNAGIDDNTETLCRGPDPELSRNRPERTINHAAAIDLSLLRARLCSALQLRAASPLSCCCLRVEERFNFGFGSL
jgi:hypothetical protein